MLSRSLKIRRWIIVLLTLLVLGIFGARLMSIQIIDAEVYKRMMEDRDISTQIVKATRGEIIDRNGNPLAINRMGYDIIFDKAFFPADKQNEIILSLITLFQQRGEGWSDTLPISTKTPYTFLPNQDRQVASLKRYLELGEYATAEDAIYWLVERYTLQDYTPAQQRKIASVRYEMEQRGFALNVPYTFATDIDMSTVVQIKERSYKLLGVDVVESAIRSYPNGTAAPHIIGSIGPMYPEDYIQLKDKGYAMDDIIGKGGVEQAFESLLRGKNGTREIYINSRGEVLNAVETQPPIPGNTVLLTLDSELQRFASESLEKQIKNLQATAAAGKGKEADAGAVVAINPQTGELLAAVTYPSYDLNTYRQDYARLSADEDGLHPLYNRALLGGYAPGSTFKPAVATAGLTYGVVEEPSTVNCTRVYTYYPGPWQPTCLGYHGHINVIDALRVSCNIFFYDVGRRVGIDNIAHIANQYGLGVPTGLEIAEYTGVVSSPKARENDKYNDSPWVPGDVLQSSIGQLYNQFSPLQLANYAATIGNRGKRMKVTIVKEVRDYSMNNLITPLSPEVADTVDATPDTINTVIKGMIAASRSGTAAAWFGNYPIDVASKTGTPETKDLPNSTFICFAPAENPQIAIAVVIEKGWHGYTGAPVARDIISHYFGFDTQQPAPAVSDTPTPQEEQPQQEIQPDTPTPQPWQEQSSLAIQIG